ncbi:MAG: non-ribosomal peptide synthetase [Woeseiaceae bacterium]
MSSYQAGSRILDIARDYPDRVALIIDGESWTYGEIVAAAFGLAAQFGVVADDEPQPITAVMVQRHVSAYIGILAARFAGHAYVPLNVNHPCQRNATILKNSGAQRVVCGESAAASWPEIVTAAGLADAALPVIACGERKADYDLESNAQLPQRRQSLDDLAYILFTSGSTGVPKGVPIQNAQLEPYLKVASSMLKFRPDDRCSQTSELTYDVSVHDMFLCWESGATLVNASEKDLRMPAAFIRDHAITCWFSVPSLAYQVRQQGDLVPGAFPSLRLSLFAGEALPTVIANEWAQAAPNSSVQNWYGPTEATITVCRYIVTDKAITEDTVPIGKAYDGMELLVLDPEHKPLPDGESGELYLSGAQVAAGYLNDPERTAASFVTLPNGKTAYRTGDRVVVNEDGDIQFLGRVDNQVKVRGYRIELGEIEAALRKASSGLSAVALAWPGDAEIATSIVGALEVDNADTAAIRQQVSAMLPDHMVPAMIFCLPEFPKNASGKIDRLKLGELLVAKTRLESEADSSGLSDEAAILLKSILTHAPLLSRKNIMSAKSLFDAGMDSIAFISFTTDVEHQFSITLDQDTVIQLSEMSFDDIVKEVSGVTNKLAPNQADEVKPSFFDRIRKLLGIPRLIQKPRANRALQFIERFPGYLQENGAPDVLCFGSSGTFRAICPSEFEPTVVLNAGFPAVNVAGMQMMCEFIRAQCKSAGVRVPLVIYELDPMHICTKPPSGDINLGPDFFEGNVISLRGKNTSVEFQWLVDTRGEWNAPDESKQKKRKPNWVRERDRVIAGAFLGEIEFDQKLVDFWYGGARALQEVSDQMVCFVHPVDQTMIDEIRDSCGSDRLDTFMDEISRQLGIEVIDWQSFDLQPDDFLDINHMNARGGRAKLSRQLAGKIQSSE